MQRAPGDGGGGQAGELPHAPLGGGLPSGGGPGGEGAAGPHPLPGGHGGRAGGGSGGRGQPAGLRLSETEDRLRIEQETGRRDRYTFNLPQDRSFTLSEVPELLLKTPAAWCRMYKKSFWDCTEIRYPENLYYEDLATTPRLIYEAKRICYAGEEPLYYYLLRQGSIMRNRNFQRSFHDRTCVLDFIRKYYIDRKADRQYKNELEYLFFEHGYFCL